MLKSLKHRLLPLLTAGAVGAASLSLGSFVSGAAGENGGEQSAEPAFSFATQDLNYLGANDLSVKLNFSDAVGNEAQVTLPDNTYYLLIHAVGSDNYMSGFTYDSGEEKDHYQLIELEADNAAVWNSGKLSVLPSKQVQSWFGTADAYPTTVTIEGTFLKNDDPSAELTLSDAQSLSGCGAVTSVEGMTLSANDTLQAADGNEWGMRDTIAVSALGGHVVDVNVYDYDGETPAKVVNDSPSRYFELAYITPKGEGSSRDNIIGWDIKEIDIENSDYAQSCFWKLNPFGEDGSEVSSDKISYSPDEHDINIRVYRAEGKDTELLTYADCIEKGIDTIPNYRFTSERTGENTKLSVIKDIVEFHIDVEFSEPAQITEDDYLYLFIKAEHQSTEDTYYYQQITADDVQSLDIVVQNAETSSWMNGNGNVLPNERFNGNETLSVKLFVSDRALNINNLISGTDCSEIAEGANFKAYTVNYGELGKTRDTDSHTTVYTDSITLSTVTATSDYDYESILGPAVPYGVTADRFEQQNHAQTNLAVNNYKTTGSNIDPDLSDPTCGDFYIANFVDFDGTDKSVVTDDPDGIIFIGTSHPEGHRATLHVDNESRLKDPRDFVDIEIDDPARMTSEVIEPIIAHMEGVSADISNRVKKNGATITPVKPSDKWIVDTTDLPDDATIYIDGDLFAAADDSGNTSVNTNGKLTIRMKESQTLIFDFDETEDI